MYYVDPLPIFFYSIMLHLLLQHSLMQIQTRDEFLDPTYI